MKAGAIRSQATGSIEPKLEVLGPMRIQGIAVRTANALEFDSQTALLPKLWARFFSEDVAAQVANRTTGAQAAWVYGVYSHYESDASGQYSVTAGVAAALPVAGLAWPSAQPDPAVDADHAAAAAAAIHVVAGPYLVFEANGPMPGAVVGVWQRIWAYFAGAGPWRRRFETDFECYVDVTQARVFIGVSPGVESVAHAQA